MTSWPGPSLLLRAFWTGPSKSLGCLQRTTLTQGSLQGHCLLGGGQRKTSQAPFCSDLTGIQLFWGPEASCTLPHPQPGGSVGATSAGAGDSWSGRCRRESFFPSAVCIYFSNRSVSTEPMQRIAEAAAAAVCQPSLSLSHQGANQERQHRPESQGPRGGGASQ